MLKMLNCKKTQLFYVIFLSQYENRKMHDEKIYEIEFRTWNVICSLFSISFKFQSQIKDQCFLLKQILKQKMKKTMVFLMGLGALSTATASNSPQNLIVNGNFNDSPCTDEFCIYNTPNTVPGWIPSPEIQIGYGFLYNQYLQKERVLDLASNTNSCVKQVVKTMQPGAYQLIFEYAARSDRLSEDCQFQVSFNGKLLKKITPKGDRIQTDTIDISVETPCEGAVQFCNIGEKNNGYGAILKSVQLVPKRNGIQILSNPQLLIPNPGQNLITNGNFKQNSCYDQYCVYHPGQFNRVKNWIPDPTIQIGWGWIYNYILGDGSVLDLAPHQNSCAMQIVRDLQPGVYQLTYEYIARDGDNRSPNTNFQVRFNERTLKKVSPTNDKIQTETIQLEVTSGTEGQLRFCSVGQSTPYGALLKSVSMTRKDDNALQKSGNIQLDSHSGKCIQKQYQFQGGLVQITLNYGIASRFTVQQSAVFLVIDGNPIYKFLPSDHGKNIKLQGDIHPGPHVVGFCSLGSPKQVPHQITVSNLLIAQKAKCVPAWGNDLIVNGGFQQNSCNSDKNWCVWNQQNIGNSVPGWMPSPQIEIGRSFLYNKNAWEKNGESWVSQLDAVTNTCIKQRVQGLKQGRNLLKFDWTAIQGRDFATSGFDVKVNGKVLKSIVSSDYDLKRESIEFTLNQNPSDPWVEFCGTGYSDNGGATIDNVKLFSSTNC